MTLFEYIAVAASLICSFVAVRVLGGIAAVLRQRDRYWVHAAWVFLVLCNLSFQWWIFWAFRDVEWSYARFILAISPFALIYVLSSLLVPADPDRVESWRDHYFDVRVRVFSLAIAILVVMVACTVLLLGHPIFHPRRIVPGSLCALFVAGLVSENPKLHAAIVIVYPAAFLIDAAIFAGPGSFGVLR